LNPAGVGSPYTDRGAMHLRLVETRLASILRDDRGRYSAKMTARTTATMITAARAMTMMAASQCDVIAARRMASPPTDGVGSDFDPATTGAVSLPAAVTQQVKCQMAAMTAAQSMPNASISRNSRPPDLGV
jgi:hypothetical protein